MIKVLLDRTTIQILKKIKNEEIISFEFFDKPTIIFDFFIRTNNSLYFLTTKEIYQKNFFPEEEQYKLSAKKVPYDFNIKSFVDKEFDEPKIKNITKQFISTTLQDIYVIREHIYYKCTEYTSDTYRDCAVLFVFNGFKKVLAAEQTAACCMDLIDYDIFENDSQYALPKPEDYINLIDYKFERLLINIDEL